MPRSGPWTLDSLYWDLATLVSHKRNDHTCAVGFSAARIVSKHVLLFAKVKLADVQRKTKTFFEFWWTSAQGKDNTSNSSS